ncbi:MAG: GntR family transcriptional regulator [Solirubrobacterales bacterium]|jgi:DNA-binding GntR family transcriptional regulator|nr:GntR family transcriptional regulator [Solirubrobacterales bacterium]
MTRINRDSPLPVYFQIALDIRARLAAREWTTGQRIAPELALAREYDVSRVTIRQALAELVKDDLLERHRGSGTYVRQQQRPLVYDLNFTVGAVANRLRESGFENRAEVMEVGLIKTPPTELRHRLAIREDGAVVFMVRRVIINDEPAAIYRSWFAAGVVPELERSVRLEESLSVVIAEDYDLVPVRSENELEVVRSTREEAALLGTSGDVPLLVVTATTFLQDGRPLEYSQIVWLGDRVRFHVTAYDAQTTAVQDARTPVGAASKPARGRRARSLQDRSTPPASG